MAQRSKASENRSLAAQVLARRRALKMSQSELADLAGISRNYVSLIERQEATNLSIKLVRSLAAALGTSAGALLGEAAEAEVFIPPPLRTFATAAGLRYDIVDRLVRIPGRGNEPHNPEEWQALFEAVRDYL